MMQQHVRVRFAPSPTGPLHMGGVRTALYNYLFAKQHNGSFLLRIEDTDQARLVPGTEDYIIEALRWCGIEPNEGAGFGDGQFGPYKQSLRGSIYREYSDKLLDGGRAYIAFDTPDELEARRQDAVESGAHSWQYDSSNRMQMRNSLALSKEETDRLIAEGTPYVVRIKMPEDLTVTFTDIIRGEVTFNTTLLDDKVLMKADGLPTYHLANVVDDHLMKITHVIRGEEWLPSTPLHVILYQAFGWEEDMPRFAHLPLILKPDGKGKLSKRDGDKGGFPVFPLDWKDVASGEVYKGFRERGFFPEAFTNILALLGWHSEEDKEIFSLQELVEEFKLERVIKSGARFDFEKATWLNQQFLMSRPNEQLAEMLMEAVAEKGYDKDHRYVASFCGLMKERVSFINELLDAGYYFFEPVRTYDEKTIQKKWKAERLADFEELQRQFASLDSYEAAKLEQVTKSFMDRHKYGFGDVLPILRIALTGTMKGPPVFEMMELIGREEVERRLSKAYEEFGALVTAE